MENNELDLQKIVRNINMIFVALFEDLKELVNNFKNKANKQTTSAPVKKPISNASGILGMASRLLSGKNENFLNLLSTITLIVGIDSSLYSINCTFAT